MVEDDLRMSFLHPALLAAGLACVSIPIIIHLLMHRRRKPVRWGAMRFLLEAYKRQQRRMMLEKWLLLALRCLLVAAIALAIGKPLLGSALSGSASKTLFVLIDNGLCASRVDSSGQSALDRHKAQAKALIASLERTRSGEGHRVGIITLAFPAEGVLAPPSLDLAAAAGVIDRIAPAESRTDVAGGLALAAQALKSGETAAPRSLGTESVVRTPIDPARAVVAVLSDFREGSLELSRPDDARESAGVPRVVRMIATEPAAAASSNTSIVSVEPLRSIMVSGSQDSSGELVRVVLRRSGEESLRQAQTTGVWARFITSGGMPAGAPPDRTLIRWQPGQESVIALVPLKSDGTARSAGEALGKRGAISGMAVVAIDDDALAADNRFRRPLDARDSLRVGVVAPSRFGAMERADKLDAPAWLRLALTPATDASGAIDAIDIEPAAIDAARLAGLDALVMPRPDLIPEAAWTRVKAFVDAGGLVMVMPPATPTVHLWPDAMERALGLGWSIAREASVPANGKLISAATGAAVGSGAAGDTSGGTNAGLFDLIDGELEELLAPVAVLRALPFQAVPENGRAVLSLGDGTPVLWASTGGGSRGQAKGKNTAGPGNGAEAEGRPTAKGLVLYLSAALELEWTNLPTRPLIVPFIQEIIRQGVGQARGTLVSAAGQRAAMPTRAVELRPTVDPAQSGRVTADARTPETVRADDAGFSPPLRNAGVYQVVDETGASRSLLAVNHDPRGSLVNVQSREQVGLRLASTMESTPTSGATASSADRITWISADDAASPSSEAVAASVALGVTPKGGAASSGMPFWWPLLFAAMALAILELTVARWASHARVDVVSGSSALGAAAVLSPREAP